LRIPLLIGGAAASQAHTALRIAPEYSGPVIYVSDAAQAVIAAGALLSDDDKPAFLESTSAKYREIARQYAETNASRDIISLEAARANRIPPRVCELPVYSAGQVTQPPFLGLLDLNDYSAEKVMPHFNWNLFLQSWEIGAQNRSFDSRGEKNDIREKLKKDAQAMLERIISEKLLRLRGVAGFFPAAADGDDVVLFGNGADFGGNAPVAEIARFCFLRNQEKKQSGAYNPCLADFFTSREQSGGTGGSAQFGVNFLGLFALSAGFGLNEAAAVFHAQNDEYSAILLATLANTLTEAFAAELHSRLRPNNFSGIRPVFGYPISPDHEDKRIALAVLDAYTRCGFTLTETAMMTPSASVCGMFIFHPDAYYFSTAPVNDDQLADWARRKGISYGEACRRAAL
jgi:5-methyltetrahydrofolate--homocysteine methyltransferase